jgi:hypothetical protein
MAGMGNAEKAPERVVKGPVRKRRRRWDGKMGGQA